MEKTQTNTNEDVGKWRKWGMSIIINMIHNAKNLFPQNNLRYTYINTFMLCLFFTFIHKYLDQTLPSLYKSIENDFNIDVKTLYYVNSMYKLAYSAFNFFFALFFDYSFKKIFFVKYEKVCATEDGASTIGNGNGKRSDSTNKDRVGGVDSGVSDTHYEIQFKGEGANKATHLNSSVKIVEEEKTPNGGKKKHNSTYFSDEVIWGEYRYTLNILVVSSIVYVVVILGIMLSNNLLYFFFFMFIMGINNSCIYILIQKIYTNNVFSENRSTIFGFLHFFSSLSHMLSISINTNLSNKFYLGFNGWRICYFVISFFPICVCIYLIGLIKQKKFHRSRSKNYSFSYLVSFDNMTDVCQESEKEGNYCKRENDKLEGLHGASKERREEKKKKKREEKQQQGEEILLFNAEEDKDSMKGNCRESSEEVEEVQNQEQMLHSEEGDQQLPFRMSKSYDNTYVLHRERLANISKTSDGTASLHNSTKLGVRHSASTSDDFNTISLISTNDRIKSNLIKRSFCHMATKKASPQKGAALNVDANRSSSGESAVSREGDYTTPGNGNYSKQGKKHVKDSKKKKKKKNSLEDDTNETTWKGTTTSSSIFAKPNEEREKYEHRDELNNLLEEDEKEKDKKLKYEFSYLYEIKYVFKNYSFWLMITMGMLNGIPKHVLSLMIYFFQYCNISDFRSGLIISLSWLCASLISPFIGIISDYIYKLNKDINRQRIGMCTHCLRIILMFTMFFFVPKEADSFIYFVIISLFMGILSGWINIGTHKPIIIDIVKQRHTAFVMALMSAFENIGSSIIGTFFLSFLLNQYNYIDKRKLNSFHANVNNVDAHVNSVHVNVNKHNVHVLSDVLLILTCFPWLISFCLLYVLKFTYKKDKLYNNLF
ncbi:hypothetical protein C922_03050 [Plasmodium inui San Antonio 1]|uniref:Major facilitator superfamily (MFS) profile domain-containing protein n=1 Tax=Plasmodium inui San Antonio 1 TaxID=1237626 RepID=W7AM60_9APIC|nr:hypothetical protein C922_03050 [Plasmodium inui San Antonio 1]EUD66416.1 hypothetical protein C922_03050 [Plasmodium inui San Antonio 1]